MPKYAELVYNGFWFSPERLALQARPPPRRRRRCRRPAPDALLAAGTWLSLLLNCCPAAGVAARAGWRRAALRAPHPPTALPAPTDRSPLPPTLPPTHLRRCCRS